MAKRSSEDEAFEVLAWMLAIFFVGAIAVVWLIFQIVKGICWLIAQGIDHHKAKKAREANNVSENTNSDKTITYIDPSVTVSNVVEDTDILPNMSIYNSLFEDNIIARGFKYYNDNLVTSLIQEDNEYTAIVKGSSEYEVKISFDKHQNIIESSCTCPYYLKGKNCKHIYATLLEIMWGDAFRSIKNEIIEKNSTIIKSLNDALVYMQDHNYDSKTIDDFLAYKNAVLREVNNLERKLETIRNTEELEAILKAQEKIQIDIKNKIDEKKQVASTPKLTYIHHQHIADDFDEDEFTDEFDDEIDEFEDTMTDDVHEFDEFEDTMTDNAHEFEDRHLDNMGLFTKEKELVKSGKYDSWNFEEEDMDEDDYYYEDD